MAAKGPLCVDGIEVHVDAEALDDSRISDAMSDLADDERSEVEKNIALTRLKRLVFGRELRAVEEALGKPHGGRVPNESMVGFLIRVIEAAGAKN